MNPNSIRGIIKPVATAFIDQAVDGAPLPYLLCVGGLLLIVAGVAAFLQNAAPAADIDGVST